MIWKPGRVTVASLCGPTCGAPLFVHVLGATLLFGALLAVTTLGFASIRIVEHGPLLRRLAFTIMLAGVWPAYILMRVGRAVGALARGAGQRHAPGWVGVGFLVSDVGILVLLVLTLLGWLGTATTARGLLVRWPRRALPRRAGRRIVRDERKTGQSILSLQTTAGH